MLPSLEERFDRALVESVEEAITDVLSKQVAESFVHYFHDHLGLSREDIPSHLKELSSTLHELFGVGGSVLGADDCSKIMREVGFEFGSEAKFFVC